VFTGLIEELGTVLDLERQAGMGRLTIQAQRVLEDLSKGSSVSVNGACLTVIAIRGSSFAADLSLETLGHTTLGGLRPGNKVNLERPLRFSDRLGGHLVTGHVDGVGRVLERRPSGSSYRFRFSLPPEIAPFMMPKGSIAVDGISLTLADLEDESFTVEVIPYTYQVTTLGFKGPGDMVNLEADVLGKYVRRLLSKESLQSSGLSLETLVEQGYIKP